MKLNGIFAFHCVMLLLSLSVKYPELPSVKGLCMYLKDPSMSCFETKRGAYPILTGLLLLDGEGEGELDGTFPGFSRNTSVTVTTNMSMNKSSGIGVITTIIIIYFLLWIKLFHE